MAAPVGQNVADGSFAATTGSTVTISELIGDRKCLVLSSFVLAFTGA